MTIILAELIVCELTQNVQISYMADGNSFNEDNLMVTLKNFKVNGQTKVWFPKPTVNATLEGNLLGTIRVSELNGFSSMIIVVKVL